MKHLRIQGNVPHGTGDDSSDYPLKLSGQARTTNPTAVQDGDRVNFIADDLGRQVFVPHQVRDLVTKNSATLTRAQETTVLAAAADIFHDVVLVSGLNSSTNAQTISIRDTTGGSAILKIRIPAGSNEAVSFEVPLPQSAVNTNWTGQNTTGGEISDSPVDIFIQAIKNI